MIDLSIDGVKPEVSSHQSMWRDGRGAEKNLQLSKLNSNNYRAAVILFLGNRKKKKEKETQRRIDKKCNDIDQFAFRFRDYSDAQFNLHNSERWFLISEQLNLG